MISHAVNRPVRKTRSVTERRGQPVSIGSFPVVLIVLLALVAAACSGSGAESRRLASNSSADVLVPLDDRFRTTFTFLIEDSPDNYTFRTNWSPAFDADIDRSLTVVGYQVSDPSQWSGGSETGDGERERAAVQAALVDSLELKPGGPCSSLDPTIELVSCRYELGPSLEPLDLMIRRVDSSGTILMAVFADTAAADYLSGEFQAVPIDDAISDYLIG